MIHQYTPAVMALLETESRQPEVGTACNLINFLYLNRELSEPTSSVVSNRPICFFFK